MARLTREQASHLSRGMVVDALIEARLLGLRLLTLKAGITILPAAEGGAVPRIRVRPERSDSGLAAGSTATQQRRAPLRRTNGDASGLLAEAARSLESSVTELQRARAQAPGSH